jgi:hypothetical protein
LMMLMYMGTFMIKDIVSAGGVARASYVVEHPLPSVINVLRHRVAGLAPPSHLISPAFGRHVSICANAFCS